jgi:hypothetical protein
MFDTYLLMPDVNVRDVATGKEQTFSQQGLALGINTTFEVGKFYENPQLASYYYCHRIDGNLAKIDLVESFPARRTHSGRDDDRNTICQSLRSGHGQNYD